MTRPSRRVADYAPSTLEFSAELVLAAAVEEAVALYEAIAVAERCDGGYPTLPPHPAIAAWRGRAQERLLAAAQSADLILGRAR